MTPRFLDEATSRAEFAPAPGEWFDVTLASGLTTPAHGFPPQMRRIGTRREMRGRISRIDGTKFATGATHDLFVTAAGDTPSRVAGGLGQVESFANPGYARLEMSEEGQMRMAPSKDTAWVGLDSLFWDIT